MPSDPLVAAVETAEQAALESSAGAEPSVDSRAGDRIATEGRGYTLHAQTSDVNVLILIGRMGGIPSVC